MEFVKSADVVVIGGGIVGTAVLRELSKYDLEMRSAGKRAGHRYRHY